jgi:hypothetical protein
MLTAEFFALSAPMQTYTVCRNEHFSKCPEVWPTRLTTTGYLETGHDVALTGSNKRLIENKKATGLADGFHIL